MAACTGTDCDVDLTAGLTLCHQHTTWLEDDLKAVPGVWAELRVTAERRDAGADSLGTSGPTGSKPPANLDALDRGQTLRVILTGWASHLPGLRPTKDNDGFLPVRMSTWLLRETQRIRTMDWAGDLQRELREAITDARKATDRAADRISLGQCSDECPGTMTAIAGASTARCRECGTTAAVNDRQAWLITEAWHVAAPLPHIIRALRTLHIFIKPKDAKNWVARGKLIACVDDDGAKTYQLRQAHAVHTAMAAKRAAAKERAEARNQAALDLESIAA